MVATLAAMAMLAAPAQNTGSQLISKMLAYYSGASSMTGTITYTAAAAGGQVQCITDLAYEKPSKLYISQRKGGSEPKRWLVTSDGKHFSYDAPAYLQTDLTGTQSRLVESVVKPVPGEFVKGPDGKPQQRMMTLGIRDIYAVAAATIGDRSVPLDIAIGRTEDLQHDNLQWITVEVKGKSTVNGVEATLIDGKWRPYGDYYIKDLNYPPGMYEMAIADDGRLLEYIVRTYVEASNTAVTLTETWDLNLTVNGKPDPNLFRVVVK